MFTLNKIISYVVPDDTCSTDIDDCASNPCENGGTCTDDVDGFTCACGANTMGLRCQTDPCASAPCQNTSTCSVSAIIFMFCLTCRLSCWGGIK